MVSGWNKAYDKVQPVSLSLASNIEGEKARNLTLIFQRDGEEWKLRATEVAVAKYAAALRGAPVMAGGK